MKNKKIKNNKKIKSLTEIEKKEETVSCMTQFIKDMIKSYKGIS
jgi:hypothetical protein